MVDRVWGSFSYINKPLLNTASSHKFERLLDSKRSRPKEKGLRKLSQRAYEIVLNMRSASYKEVANRLVDELNNEQELDNGVHQPLCRKRMSKILREESMMPSMS
jgi:shikimate kinase